MIIVATSVWIDFFYGQDSPEVHTLERMLAAGEDICACGVIRALTTGIDMPFFHGIVQHVLSASFLGSFRQLTDRAGGC